MTPEFMRPQQTLINTRFVLLMFAIGCDTARSGGLHTMLCYVFLAFTALLVQ